MVHTHYCGLFQYLKFNKASICDINQSSYPSMVLTKYQNIRSVDVVYLPLLHFEWMEVFGKSWSFEIKLLLFTTPSYGTWYMVIRWESWFNGLIDLIVLYWYLFNFSISFFWFVWKETDPTSEYRLQVEKNWQILIQTFYWMAKVVKSFTILIDNYRWYHNIQNKLIALAESSRLRVGIANFYLYVLIWLPFYHL